MDWEVQNIMNGDMDMHKDHDEKDMKMDEDKTMEAAAEFAF